MQISKILIYLARCVAKKSILICKIAKLQAPIIFAIKLRQSVWKLNAETMINMAFH